MGSTVKKATNITKSVLTGDVGGAVGQVVGGVTQPFERGPVQIGDKTAFTRQLAGKGTQEELRKKQRAQSERLEARASGEAPSLAEAQLRSAQERSLAQQLAAAQAQRGGNQAALQRNLMRSQAAQSAQLGQQAVEARLAEQAQAEASLANQLGQQRQQDIGLAGSDRSSLQALENLQAGFASQAQQANQQLAGGVLGSLGGIGASMFGAKATSDEDEKKNIKKGSNEAQNFLDALQAHVFEYKDKKDGKGEHLGIMAQALEKAGKAGKQMVKKDSEGKKVVDMGQGFAAILAAQAHLNDKIKALESKKKKK